MLVDAGVTAATFELPHTNRKRLLTVEHVQLIPPYSTDNGQASGDSRSGPQVKAHVLKRENSLLSSWSAVSAWRCFSISLAALNEELEYIMRIGPRSKFAGSSMSITKVGLGSTSRNSVNPMLCKSCAGDVSGRSSGLRGTVVGSVEVQLPGVPEERGGLAALTWPLGSRNVVTVSWGS